MSVALHLAKADLVRRVPEPEMRVWVYYVWGARTPKDRTWVLNNRVPEALRKWVTHECKRFHAAKQGANMAHFDRDNGVYRRPDVAVGGAKGKRAESARSAGQGTLF